MITSYPQKIVIILCDSIVVENFVLFSVNNNPESQSVFCTGVTVFRIE